jgi:hypothetical protein
MHAFRFPSAPAKPLVPALAALTLLLGNLSFVGSADAAVTVTPSGSTHCLIGCH